MASHRTFSVQQVARKWNVTEQEVREALNRGLLQSTLTPKWGMTQQDVIVWLLRTGRVTQQEFMTSLQEVQHGR